MTSILGFLLSIKYEACVKLYDFGFLFDNKDVQ